MPRPKKEQPNHGNLYEVKITVGKTFDGKLIRKSFYSSTSKADARAQAEQYKIDQKAAQLAGTVFVDQDVTFRTWAVKWLETYKKGKVKGNTYESTYRAPVEKHLVPYFGDAQLDVIKPVDIQSFFNSKASTSSLESMKKMRACLRAIFDTAVENDLCRRNPVTKNLVLRSDIKDKQKRTYTQEQYDTAHSFAQSHKDGLSILVLLETGISRSELLGLRWEDFDAALGLLYIRQGLVQQKDSASGKVVVVSDGLKNDHRHRVIPISPDLVARLEALPREIPVGGNNLRNTPARVVATTHIFHAPEGGPFSPANWDKRVFHPFMHDLHVAHPEVPELNAHELRHTRATLWKDDGVDLFSIAKLLGHADLDMLAKRYAHNNVDTLRRALGYEVPGEEKKDADEAPQQG